MTSGTLNPGEPHPAAKDALKFLSGMPMAELQLHLNALSSCAIEGNRLAEICAETLRRLLDHEPVSDRYLLGLAWTIRSSIKEKERLTRKRKPA